MALLLVNFLCILVAVVRLQHYAGRLHRTDNTILMGNFSAVIRVLCRLVFGKALTGYGRALTPAFLALIDP
jgi:hypothetical protein